MIYLPNVMRGSGQNRPSFPPSTEKDAAACLAVWCNQRRLREDTKRPTPNQVDHTPKIYVKRQSEGTLRLSARL